MGFDGLLLAGSRARGSFRRPFRGTGGELVDVEGLLGGTCSTAQRADTRVRDPGSGGRSVKKATPRRNRDAVTPMEEVMDHPLPFPVAAGLTVVRVPLALEIEIVLLAADVGPVAALWCVRGRWVDVPIGRA